MATHDPAKAAGFFSDRRHEDDLGPDHSVEDPPVPGAVAASETPEPTQFSQDFFTDDRGQAAATGGFFGGTAGTDTTEAGTDEAGTDTDDDPATDPALRVADPLFVAPPPYGDFDPSDPQAYRPPIPWYQKSSAKLALGAIAAAAVAIVIAASLLLVNRPESGPADENTTPAPTSSSTTSATPTTTPQSSVPAPPPPPLVPPPPPESPPPTAGTRATSAPQGPRYTQRPQSTWTRNPDSANKTNIPVLPSRTFPNSGRN